MSEKKYIALLHPGSGAWLIGKQQSHGRYAEANINEVIDILNTPPGVSPLVWVNGRKAAPKGHVLTDEGVVLKVLGSLPVTADGCVVCVGGLVWMHGDEFGEPTPVSALVQEVAEDDICYHNAANDDGILSGGREVGREWLSNCYSTRAAAEASRTEGQ